jgi:hypothetical protein
MGAINTEEVYEYDVTDDEIGPVLLNRQSAALTARFGSRLDVKRVANVAERSAYYTAFGTGTVARPCIVHRADAVAGLRIEFNDGTGWKTFLTHKEPIRTVFTSTGTYTPTAGVWYIEVEVVGSGGGGGGTASSVAGSSSLAGGGGGGGYAKKKILASALGATETVTINNAGAGGVGANPGGAGGTVSFGAHCSASGGGAGPSGPSSSGSMVSRVGGAGGTGTGGDVNVAGSAGGTGYSGTDVWVVPSTGGTSGMGFGAGAQNSGTSGVSSNGTAGSLYGGGGSGSYARGTGASSGTGGAGAKGVVIVTEYF